MHINSNIPSLRAHGQLLNSNRLQGNSMRRLSTGFQVNSVSDDPASMSIANRMRRELDGISAASQNTLDAISIIQTADGALNEVTSMLNRVRDLMVQSANDTLTNDNREAIQREVDQLLDEIDRITTQATFNSRSIFAGTFEDSEGNIHGIKQVRVGTRENILMDLNLPSIHTSLLGRGVGIEMTVRVYDPDTNTYIDDETFVYSLDALRSPDSTAPRIVREDNSVFEYERRFGVLNFYELEESFPSLLIQILDASISDVTEIRSRLGAYENRLFTTHENLETQSEQLSESLSRIIDTDMALEMSRLTQQQILFQATISVKAMSNQRPQMLLALVNF